MSIDTRLNSDSVAFTSEGLEEMKVIENLNSNLESNLYEILIIVNPKSGARKGA